MEPLQSNPRFTSAQARLLLLLSLSVFINYVDRGNLSIAAPLLKNELGLSPEKMGLLLSAFFWTYASFQLVAGWLVDRFHVGWILAGGFLLWSASTAATGLVHGFVALFAARLILGIGESVAYPAYSKIIAREFPQKLRGRANAAISFGSHSGPAFGIFVGAILMARFGWRPFFLVIGLVTLLWLVPWVKWMPKRATEAAEIGRRTPSVREILVLRSAWGTFLGLFCANYILYFLITWLPLYLVQERHFSMNKMGSTGGLAFVVMAMTNAVSGWASDRWIRSGASPTLVRKSLLCFQLIGAGLSIGFLVVAGPNLAIALLMLACGFFGVGSPQIWSVSQTLSGSAAAGRWAGIKNFFGNLAGIAAPALTGIIVGRTGHFFWAFLLTSAVALSGSLIWIFVVGSVEPVVWAD